MAPAPKLGHRTENWGRTFWGDDSVCSGQQALREGSIYNKGGGHTTDILFQRSEVLLFIYSLLLRLEIIQSTSHFGPPQPVPGLRLGWQNPLGSLRYWAPSQTPHLETLPYALLCWRPRRIRETRCHKGMPRQQDTHTSYPTQGHSWSRPHTNVHAHVEPHVHTQ